LSDKTITGVVTWLRNWFYTKSEVNSLISTGGTSTLNQEFYFDDDDFVVISDEPTTTKTLIITWNDNNNENGLRPRYLQPTINGITAYLSEESEWSVSIPVDTEDSYAWSIPSVTGYVQTSYNEVDNVTTVTLVYRKSTPPTPSEPPTPT